MLAAGLCAFAYTVPAEGLASYYRTAEAKMDGGDYAGAIASYERFLDRFYFNPSVIFYPDETEADGTWHFDGTRNVKEHYFALYNIACCHSLLRQYDEAEEYVVRALIAGYPYIDYIFRDGDMSNLFRARPHLEPELRALYAAGNDTALLDNKSIRLGYLDGGGAYSFTRDSDGTIRFTYEFRSARDVGIVSYAGKGTCTMRNFTLVLTFTELTETEPVPDSSTRRTTAQDATTDYLRWWQVSDDIRSSGLVLGADWSGLYQKDPRLPNFLRPISVDKG